MEQPKPRTPPPELLNMLIQSGSTTPEANEASPSTDLTAAEVTIAENHHNSDRLLRLKKRRIAAMVGAVITSGTVLLCMAAFKTNSHEAAMVKTSSEQASIAKAQKPFTIISSGDFTNTDIGDLSELPSWNKGMLNSTSPYIETALKNVFYAMRTERASAFLVPGDLHEGEWGRDTQNTGIFGPVKTRLEQREAIKKAAELYDEQYIDRLRLLFSGSNAKLHFYPAVGDHEYGDNPWRKDGTKYEQLKYDLHETFKDAFNKHFLRNEDGAQRFTDRPEGPANKTAYATYLNDDVLLVTLDCFEKTDNEIVPMIDDQQLRWLNKTLKAANQRKTKWIVVQQHPPAIGPVRKKNSSAMSLQNSVDRPHHVQRYWNILKKAKVDFLFTGEVHAVTAATKGGVTQISHGGLFMASDFNYMTVSFEENEATVITKAFRGVTTWDRKKHIWHTNMNEWTPVQKVIYPKTTVETGRIVQTSNNHVVSRTGILRPFRPSKISNDAVQTTLKSSEVLQSEKSNK